VKHWSLFKAHPGDAKLPCLSADASSIVCLISSSSPQASEAPDFSERNRSSVKPMMPGGFREGFFSSVINNGLLKHCGKLNNSSPMQDTLRTTTFVIHSKNQVLV